MRGVQQALFLHGGPGLNSGIERLWFDSGLPIRWWDQPGVDGEAAPFDTLVKAAAAQLAEMAKHEPIHLVAHSFGGQIAYALARDYPRRIRRITLLGCAADPANSMIRLCHRIVAQGGSAALAQAVRIAETDLNLETFKAMVLAGASDPAYPAVYFGPGSAAAQNRFLALMPQIFLDLATFLTVMNGFLRAPPLEPLPGFHGEVDLIMGRHDPVLSLAADAATWSRVFPQAKIVTVEAGHIIHLETAPAIWFTS